MKDEKPELIEVRLGNVTIVTTEADAERAASFPADPRKRRELRRASGVLVKPVAE